jgi:hypothetical protein
MFEEKILYKELSFKIVGLAMQVHTNSDTDSWGAYMKTR